MSESPPVKKPPTIKWTVCDRCDVRDGHDWAIIMIDDKGMLSIQSDYGNYAYYWGSPGKDFKTFLTELDNDYLMGKLGRRDHFNGPETVKRLRVEFIKQLRDRHSLKWKYDEKHLSSRSVRFKEWVRDAWEEIARLDDGGSSDAFYHSFTEASTLCEAVDIYGGIDAVMEFEPSLMNFVNKLWPIFTSHLKEQIAAANPKSVQDMVLEFSGACKKHHLTDCVTCAKK